MRYIKLFANCILVKGFRRSFIYDLQRPTASNAIPNDLYDILVRFHRQSVEEIKEIFKHKFDDTIEEYFQFLLDREFAYEFAPDELELFPEIDDIWDKSSTITNAILKVQPNDFELLNNALRQLSLLRCDAVQLHYTAQPTNYQIFKLSEILSDLRIFHIEVAFNASFIVDIEEILKIAKKQPRFQRLFIGNLMLPSINASQIVCVTPNILNINKQCGKVSADFFAINMDVFYEAQHHNTCLNRKICIDENGDIKNCPAMEKSYGNIRDTTLQEAIEKPGFKDCWTICKDQIDVCKDCEFRYMCTDCRAFIKDPGNPYSQPAKCTYNPYICLWQGQAGYVPVEECGTYSRETGFVPDKKKIAELNKQIWNEEE